MTPSTCAGTHTRRLVGVFLSLLLPSFAHAATTVSTSPSSNTTWDLAGSPYTLTTTITVPAGVTLTISPGVLVMASSSAGLDVDGTLVAVGTAAAPITFTRSGASGLWSGLSVTGTPSIPGSASLAYVNVSFGGSCTFCADLYVENSTSLTVANSTFTDSGGNGIYAHTGSVDVSDTTFTNNALNAIRYDSATSNPVLARLTATGNGTNAVSVGGGTMNGAYVWESTGLPYVITTSQTLATGGTLTIQPGVTARFGSGVRMTINGVLTANGSPVSPITLAGTTGGAGFWDGFQIINATASASLDSVAISDAGLCALCADLYVDGATVQVKRSSFSTSAKDGIDVHTGTVNVSDSSFTSNGRYAINYETATIDPVLSNLTATGNATNAVAVGPGTMNGAFEWEATGVPYVVTGSITVAAGSSLQIDPGVQALFATAGALTIKGLLRASGSATLPISMTGQAGTPGSWAGIAVSNTLGATPASATLDYVDLAGGGGGCTNCADLFIDNGRVQVTHSTIRDSAKDGVWQHSGSGSSIESTHIIGNAGYGVNNDQTRTTYAVQATNDWWGSASGPTSPCVSGGSGSSVRGSVAVLPFLTAANAVPDPVAASNLQMISLTPLRWFAPADGGTRLFVKITMRDGNGVAIPGRILRLSSSIGTVVDGGTTDINGSTFAYVTSLTAGDAILSATTDVETNCVFARSQPSTVTFTAAGGNPLRPNVEAPYVDGGIKISPQPITQGVLTTISATLTNTNSVPITVDATFGFAQSGIGLTFGPIGQVSGTIIPANSDKTIQVQWTPVVSGRYCIQLQYNAAAAASSPNVSTESVKPLLFGFGSDQDNVDAESGNLSDKGEKDSLDKADEMFGLVSNTPAGDELTIPEWIVGEWWDWARGIARGISNALGGADPPRLDYKSISLPDAKPVLPATTVNSDVSAARIAAGNAVTDAMLDVIVLGRVTLVSIDKAGGAAQANDLLWNSQQIAAVLEYRKRLGNAALNLADKEDAFRQVLTNEGVTTIPVTLAAVQAYQAKLSTQGFTAAQINAAHLLGYSDADIAARLQSLINADPTTMTGDMFTLMASEATVLRKLGNALTNPTNFPPPTVTVSTSRRAGTLATIPNPNHLARIYPVVTTVALGNPTASTATIDLRPRVIDLPSDWTVVLSPASVTLDPGAQTNVTVTITPGSPVPQGITPRVGVEGYIGTMLLGGVAVDVMVPTSVPFRMSIGGDANGDGSVTPADVFYMVNNLFAGGPAPVVGDANGDGVTNAADVFYLINYLFAGGPPPV